MDFHVLDILNFVIPRIFDVINLLILGTLAFITAWYAKSTRQMLEEMRTQNRPYVFVQFEMPEPSDLLVSIANGGNRVASDIIFKVIRDLQLPSRRSKNVTSFSALEPIKNGIRYLPPNSKLIYNFGMPPIGGKEIDSSQSKLEFLIRYRQGRIEYQETIEYDFSILKNVYFRAV